MARVVAVEPLASLTAEEEQLLWHLIRESAIEWNLDDLAVYVVQTSVRQDEIDRLRLTTKEIAAMENPNKTVAPRDAEIIVGGFIENYSDREWAASVGRLELRLVPTLTATDEEGEPA